MILAVTCNPAIDRSLWVPRLDPGQVHRAVRVHCAAGGKGMNVVRAAMVLGIDALACAPLAGHAGRRFEDLARGERLPGVYRWRADGETRNCLLIHHEDGDSTVVNEPGSEMSQPDWDDFSAHVETAASDAQAVVFSGSVPPGPPPSALADLAGRVASESRAVYLDTSGAALAAALRRPSGLCFKTNAEELSEAFGEPGADATEDSLAAAAKRLLERGAALVVVTRGAAGALAWDRASGWRAEAPEIPVVSSVGSGDAFMAAFAAARLEGGDLPAALTEAVAGGAANATSPLPANFPRGLARSLRTSVRVKRLD